MENKMKRTKRQKNKKGQEEMVGFALIIIIVAVILLVLLGLSLGSPQQEEVESYEVDSFIQAFLQYTSDCRDDFENLSIKELIIDCNDNRVCLDERNTCEVLDSNLRGIIEESWKVGADRPVLGYELKILSNSEELLLLMEGNKTRSYKGSMQPLGKKNIKIFFTAYY
jgi:hypothetical protein